MSGKRSGSRLCWATNNHFNKYLHKPMLRLLTVFFILLPFAALSQHIKLNIEYDPQGEFLKELDSTTVDVRILGFSDTIKPNMETGKGIIYGDRISLYDGKRELSIDSLPPGNYRISLSARLHTDDKIYAHFISAYSEMNVSLSPGLHTVRMKFPEDCSVYKHIYDKTCPKCYKTDAVIPIIYGFPIGDHPEEWGEIHQATCTMDNCHTYWYCTRDKLEF